MSVVVVHSATQQYPAEGLTPKYVDRDRAIFHDWTDDLEQGASVASVEAFVVAGSSTVVASPEGSSKTRATVSGGTVGERQEVRVEMTDSLGNTDYVKSFALLVIGR